jgi:UDP-N-acetylmuramate dehydrogenase
MTMDDILEKLSTITNEKNIFQNEPMKKHTTFRTGGPADILVTPTSEKEMIECLKLDVKKTTIGNGSNLLVKDGGIRGLVIQTTKLNNIRVEGENIFAESGAFLSKISNVAKDNSLTGIEFASGIPGTLGGAVAMNAGAYGGEMKDVILKTRYADCDGNVFEITDHEFDYRKSFFTGKEYVILSSEIQLHKGVKSEIEEKMKELMNSRNSKQPVNMPSAGSTFKRPTGFFAGKLIEDSGLKGYSIGGASVSTLHAGFIVNNGEATSKDILNLISYIQNKVYENYNVKLETEVKIIGED